jgi:N-methylhydantoinase A
VLQHKGECWATKVLTTPGEPEQGVLTGVHAALALAGIELSAVDTFIHGTTLATNAIIERRGAKTALIATDGFRDTLEFGTESRYDQYELALVRPTPLVPRPLRFKVRERIDARGAILLRLNEADVRTVAASLRDAGVRSVAIAFLHGYANDVHERRCEMTLREMLPDLRISLSSEVYPEIREYERTSTTVTNAYVQPMMETYLRSLETRLGVCGMSVTLSSPP